MINPVTFSGIAVFGSSSVKVTPPSPAPYVNGYLAGDILPAQHLNYFLGSLTSDDSLSGVALNKLIAELDYLVTQSGGSITPGDDTQVYTAVKAIARGGYSAVTASGTTVLAQVTEHSNVRMNNSGGAATLDISAGASFIGCNLTISEIHSNGVTIQTGTGQTAVMGIGSVHLCWDGTNWEMLKGPMFHLVFASGSGSTWKAPFSGVYKVTAVGGGGGSGGCDNSSMAMKSSGAGGGGGAAIKAYYVAAGTTLTYTVGTGGTAGNTSGSNGGAGNNSTVSDGTTTITGGGGSGGYGYDGTHANVYGGVGGTATNGDMNCVGQAGGGGGGSYAGVGAYFSACAGGCSIFGGGGRGGAYTAGGQAGTVGGLYGGGAGGSFSTTTSTIAGAIGGAGVVIIEF